MLKYTELRSAPRVDLSQAVPLSLPLTVFIQPTNVCNFRCNFCPESLPDYQQRAGFYHRLPMSLYEVIVSELKGWGKIKALKFYMEGEPLLNPDLPRMIRIAKDAGVADRLELTTNASLFNEGTARLLVESGLDYVRLSIYGVDERHTKITGSRYTAEQIRANVHAFRQVRDAMGSQTPILYAQYLADSPEDEEAFRSQYSDIADEIAIEPRHNWGALDTRLVNIGQQLGRYPKQACPEPFYTLAIRANGDVSVCCIDWSGGLIVGNLRDSSLREIWEGEPIRRIQSLHLAKKRDSIPACRNCTLIYNFPDNLDHLSEEEFRSRAGLELDASVLSNA